MAKNKTKPKGPKRLVKKLRKRTKRSIKKLRAEMHDLRDRVRDHEPEKVRADR
jgi:hypothetical protein